MQGSTEKTGLKIEKENIQENQNVGKKPRMTLTEIKSTRNLTSVKGWKNKCETGPFKKIDTDD